MASNWYYAKKQQRFGPVPFDDLRQLAAVGRILPGDLVVEQGSQTWCPAEGVPGLAFGPGEGEAIPDETVLSPQDQEKLNGTAAAFLAVPLYMLAVGMMTASLLLELSPRVTMNAGVLKFLLLFYVALVGVGVRSLQCLLTLKSDPFRAVAMGRYVFGLYVVVGVALSLLKAWPQGDTHWLGILEVLLDASSDLGEKLALLVFLHAAYARLKGDRPAYTLEHFWHDVTFGWQGKEYGWGRSPVGNPAGELPAES